MIMSEVPRDVEEAARRMIAWVNRHLNDQKANTAARALLHDAGKTAMWILHTADKPKPDEAGQQYDGRNEHHE